MELHFLPPADVWSINAERSMHWAKRSRLVKAWRECSHVECVAAKLGPQPPSVVTVTLPFARNARRDPMNYFTVVKAIVDGLVDAGLWPDDTNDYVTVTQPILSRGTAEVVVTITPLGATG